MLLMVSKQEKKHGGGKSLGDLKAGPEQRFPLRSDGKCGNTQLPEVLRAPWTFLCSTQQH